MIVQKIKYKIIMISDTHLNRTFPNRVDTLRVNSHNEVFRQVVDHAIKERVNFILHGGDLFDIVRPWPTVVKFLKEQIYRMGQHEIKFVVIRGNHDGGTDKSALKRGSPIIHGELPNLDNFYYVDPINDLENGHATPGRRKFGDLEVFGCGYFGYKTADFYNQYVVNEKVTSKFPILLLHSFIEEINTDVDYEINEFVFPLHDILLHDFKICGVGHFHGKRDPVLKRNTTFLGPGSLERMDFYQPAGFGFYLITIFDDFSFSVKYENVIPLYPMISIQVRSPKTESKDAKWYVSTARKRIETAISKTSQDVFLDIKFKGVLTEDSPPIDITTLTEFLKKTEQVKYFNIDDQVNLDFYQVTKTIQHDVLSTQDVLDFFREHMDEQCYPLFFDIYNQLKDLINDEISITKTIQNELVNEFIEKIRGETSSKEEI